MAVRLSKADAARIGLSFGLRASARTKYGNVRTAADSPIIGEKVYDSRWEAQLGSILDQMVMAGEIRTFLDQVRISLRGQTDAGKRRFMVVDFMLIDLFGRAHWWDAKAVTSAKWQLQRDLAWQMHKIDVKPVRKGAHLPEIYGEDERELIRDGVGR